MTRNEALAQINEGIARLETSVDWWGNSSSNTDVARTYFWYLKGKLDAFEIARDILLKVG